MNPNPCQLTERVWHKIRKVYVWEVKSLMNNKTVDFSSEMMDVKNSRMSFKLLKEKMTQFFS